MQSTATFEAFSVFARKLIKNVLHHAAYVCVCVYA